MVSTNKGLSIKYVRSQRGLSSADIFWARERRVLQMWTYALFSAKLWIFKIYGVSARTRGSIFLLWTALINFGLQLVSMYCTIYLIFSNVFCMKLANLAVYCFLFYCDFTTFFEMIFIMDVLWIL